uniref:RE49242p n=1 Tax=Drosophila melanogaster TaxID=7227 RepID=Q58CK9_DROME|nr:RE49242p [Drosophila melanogaster]
MPSLFIIFFFIFSSSCCPKTHLPFSFDWHLPHFDLFLFSFAEHQSKYAKVQTFSAYVDSQISRYLVAR